jgi:hypothetical protein
MAKSVVPSPQRSESKNVRTDSHPSGLHRTDSLPVRTGSPPLRMDAKQQFLADINEVRTRLGVSVDSMAACAGVAVSQMSEALAGKEGRNFAGHWLTAQGPEFEDTYNAVVRERRGISPEDRRARVAKDIGELVRRIVEGVA